MSTLYQGNERKGGQETWQKNRVQEFTSVRPVGWLLRLVFFYGKLTHWWVLVIGFAIEAIFLHMFFEMGWKKAITAALVINTASALVGFIAFPFIFIPVLPLEPPQTIIALIIIIAYFALVDNFMELSLIRLVFRIRVTLRRFLIFLSANAFTGGLVYIALLTIPSKI